MLDTLPGRLISVGDIELNLLERPGDDPPLVLLHGLTANAHSMDGLIAAGLSQRVLAVDLRGRGDSSKPDSGYDLAHHAQDIVGLLDALCLPSVVLVGHSFGALVSMYLANFYADRVERLILLDMAHEVPYCDQVFQMIRPSVDRLGRCWPSWESYLQDLKGAAYFEGWWDPQIESYLRADLETLSDGSVRSKVSASAITQVMVLMSKEDWHSIVRAIAQPTLLVHAPEPFGRAGAPPLIAPEMARETARQLQKGRLVTVPGNHITMLYSAGAAATVQAIHEFMSEASMNH